MSADISPFLPDAVTIGPRHLQVGDDWVASFAVVGYPHEVGIGWLQPLLTYAGRLDVSLHVEPIDPASASAGLRKQLARLESGRRHDSEKGRLLDPHTEAATEDAYELSARLARGEGKLFRVGLYLTVHAPTEESLADEVAAVRALAASLLLDCQPTTYRTLQGWTTTLPLGMDLIRLRRTLDTSSLAAAFPFSSPDLSSTGPPSGVLYGFNPASGGLVHHDRFALPNYNSVILGRSGAGKSYLVKLEILRSLYQGIEIHVVDPEDEYARLADAVGGTRIRLGSDTVRFNPFDLPITVLPNGRRTAPRDLLNRRSLFLHTVISVLLSTNLDSSQTTALDQAITSTYHKAGITSDSRTWTRTVPVLTDLAATLSTSDDPVAQRLAAQLRPFTKGAFSQLFSGSTTTKPEGHLVVYSLRALADELKPIGTLLTLDAIWRQVANPALRRPRFVVVDEGWLLMQQQAGAQFLFRLAKSGRKHWTGVTIATQDAADVLGSDLGQAIVANAATQILLRQATQAIELVGRTFALSEGERQFLLAADRGNALLSIGTERVAFQSLASPVEHNLITTDPAEVAAFADQEPDDTFIELEDEVDDH